MILYALYGIIIFLNHLRHIRTYKVWVLIPADMNRKFLYDLICLLWWNYFFKPYNTY